MSQKTIIARESGERIDALLARSGFTRSAAVRLIGEGNVLRNGKPVKKSDLTRTGDVISVRTEDEPAPAEAKPEDIPLDVVFEDADVMTEREMQDYASTDQDLHDKFAGENKAEKSDVIDDIVFEMELIRQIEVNIDYILFLVEKYKDSGNQDREIIADIRRKVASSPNLRNKKDLIESFIESLNPEADSVSDEWLQFIERAKKDELEAIIAEEGLKPAETVAFVNQCFREGEIKETGTEITRILPPMPLFTKAGHSQAKKDAVIRRLKVYFDRFYDISR